MDLLFLNVT